MAERSVVAVVAAVGAAAAVVAARLPADKAVLVAYSGGKDSLCVLDLCLRAGKRVEAFFMHFMPGMDYSEHWCSYAERRFGVTVHRVQHPILSDYLRRGVFGGAMACPAISHNDVEAEVRNRTGIDWIGYGYKLCDSPSRRSYLTFMADWGITYDRTTKRPVYSEHFGLARKLRRFSPIINWSDRDVRAYLGRRDIALPEMSDRKVNGIALIPSVLRDLRDQWPEDYRRVIRAFPGAAAQADRVEKVARMKRDWRATLRAAQTAEQAQAAE